MIYRLHCQTWSSPWKKRMMHRKSQLVFLWIVMGLKLYSLYFQHVVLCLEQAANWLFTKLYELVLLLSLVLKTAIHKIFFRNEAVSDGAISFYIDQLMHAWALAFPNSRMVLRVTQTTNSVSNAFISVPGTTNIPVGLLLALSYPKTLSCLFPFFKSLSKLFKNLLFVECPSIWDEGI